MKIIRLLRITKGYVSFKAAGGFTERFINLCARNSVQIFNSAYNCGVFIGEVYADDFSRLRTIARKTGVRISVSEKRGVPFYYKISKHRIGLIIGCAIYFLLIFVLNLFVWNIDASGSDIYCAEQIIETAKQAGVVEGIFRPLFDEKKAAREIYKLYGNKLSWVTVNIKGSRCFIEVRDSENKKQEVLDTSPSNLVADFDGVILSDETLSGIKSISKGNAVKTGDLLVSGVIENEDGSVAYYPSQGNFTARHMRNVNVACDGDDSVSQICEVKKKCIVHFLGVSVPFGEIDESDIVVFKRNKYAEYGGYRLPVGYTVITAVSLSDSKMDKNESKYKVSDSFVSKAFSVLKNTTVLDYKISLFYKNDSFYIDSEYDCVDFIGITKPIIVENNER